MEIAKTYSPQGIEDKWYKHWMDQGFFRSVPDEREPYCIVIPPPNVTGVLHMGHMLNNTIQDVLVRRARMLGKNALWVPGTDHASIATEAKVVAMLKEKGIKKSDLTRDEFLGYAWEWKEKYGGIILDQLKKLGASCDWERTRFTMEDSLSEAVIDVFIDLHKKGHIYRGTRMVNWDPQGLTAISDEEVNYKEVRSRLTYIRYQIEDDIDTYITIATTRPETILGDTAICVHPDDERYKLLIGKNAIIPLAGRSIPIIADEYVTMEFGTGALKVTPAHDLNDYELGVKHKLPSIDILNPNGTLSEAAGLYVGEDRFVVRKKISAELEAGGFIDKVEEINNKVGYSERTDAVIEPRISQQWFLNMQGLAKPALENVMNDTIRLVPDKFKNTYRHWMENVHDWCISRQLWWGQRIPAWYLPDGTYVVAATIDEALKLGREKSGNNFIKAEELRQDEDVLDTWFSSWLWPISVFDGFKDPNNADINYYYPTNDLVTAPEILFFWVARMVMAGYEYRGEMPFSHVYLTGIVRDKQGRKMSKSLGNSPEPLELIEKYGADGVRVGMLLCSPAGNDILFDESSCEQGRNFSNKIWNAFRLIQGWEIVDEPADAASKAAIAWFDAKWKAEIEIINDHFTKYRISDALMATYKLIWDDFCAWYLEMVKPAFGSPASREVVNASTEFFSVLMRILHPFSPFISEEIWHLINERTDKDCIIVAEWPKADAYDKELLTKFRLAEGIISGIRAIRNEKGISPKESLKAYVNLGSETGLGDYEPVITKLANLSELKIQSDKVEGAYVFLLGTAEVSVPLEGFIDAESEKVRIEKDLEYNRGFLKSVTAKLSNERFVNNAKVEVVDAERKKAADAEARIQSLEQQLAGLN